MKRTLSLILAVFMLATLVPMSIMAATSFKDVKSTDYYSVAAGKLSENGILKGYPDGTFGAERAITRAEMAAIVCRMIGVDTTNKENLKSVFTDVADNHWAIAEIYAASEKKIINGDGDGTFRPEDDVKHEEAIKMVVCALGLVGEDIKIDPVDWSAPYIKIADENGITEKLVGTKGAKSTRGDVAVMVYNGIASNVKAPTASVKEGTYTSSQKVELKSDVKDAQIFYTINGDTPTEKSTLYTKAITISKSCTLKAIVVSEGVPSKVLTVEYKIKSSGGSGGSSGGSSNDDSSNDDSSYDDNSGNDDVEDDGSADAPAPEEPKGPTEEEIKKSEEICADLEKVIPDIERVFKILDIDIDPEWNDDPVNLKVSEKTKEILEYVNNDITLTLEAAENGTIISKEYVRSTYEEDISKIKAIIDEMTDEEFTIFKNEKMFYLNVGTLNALAEHFDINKDYRK